MYTKTIIRMVLVLFMFNSNNAIASYCGYKSASCADPMLNENFDADPFSRSDGYIKIQDLLMYIKQSSMKKYSYESTSMWDRSDYYKKSVWHDKDRSKKFITHKRDKSISHWTDYDGGYGNPWMTIYDKKRHHAHKGHHKFKKWWKHHKKHHDHNIPEVPVPGAVWLFISGLLGLTALARRKTV